MLIGGTVLDGMLHTLASAGVLKMINILFYELEVHSMLRDPYL